MPPTLWNPHSSLDRLDQDFSLLMAVIDIFNEDCEPLSAKLRSLLDSGNVSEAGRAAHSLKGLASHFDATRVARVAEEVELLCRDEQAVIHSDLLRRLDAEIAALRIELNDWKCQAASQRWRPSERWSRGDQSGR